MGTITRIVDDQGHMLQGSGVVSTKEISEQNDFSPVVTLRGRFNLTISGTFPSTTVTLQRSYDNGVTWHDRAAYTEATDVVLEECERNVLYRMGVKTGDYDGGPVTVRLGQ